jgi:hypothetical protein
LLSQVAERLKTTFLINMKKQLFLSAAIFISTFAMAQTQPSFGIRGGLSSAGIHGDAMNSLNKLVELTDGIVTTGNRTGFFAGTYATIPLSGNISIEPALYYTLKGYELKGGLAMKAVNLLGINANARLNAHYIDLPVLLKANINGFQVFAGPEISYLTKAGLKTTAGVLGINLLNNNQDVTSQFNRWDAGLTGGIGYQFTNGINITAAYEHGLSKLDANKSLNSYNRSFKIGLGFRL